ncbi:MAG TPA: hypothetical protein VMU22_10740 [Rhizomicrobium sp.]|nr:hypothetical protein [Rhizomicrobium sp.]
MSPAQSAFAVLAMFFFVAGLSLSVSASVIPGRPGFRIARRQIAWLATLCIAGSVAALSWVARP